MELQFLSPDESVHGVPGATIGDFWKWAYSDVLSNRNRSILAEFIVGVALGVVDKPRVEWDAVDLRYNGFKIEVKSSAECQSWYQAKPSRVKFSIRKALAWDPETGIYKDEAARCADVYVFCHYPEKDKIKANVLDVPAWDFDIMPIDVLNREFKEAKSVSLSALRRMAACCKFAELRATVDRMLIRPKVDVTAAG